MHQLLAPEARGERRLALCLALIAGYVDAYGLHSLGTFVSFLSGNTTEVGSLVGRGRLAAALPSVVAIACFVLGCVAGAMVTHLHGPRSRRLLFTLVAMLLGLAVVLRNLVPIEASILLLATAMGLMNTTLRKVGPEAVNLTFVTGTLNRMARHLALGLLRAPLEDALGSWDSHFRRAGLLASLWAVFLGGAIVSSIAEEYFGVAILVAPLIVLLALAAFSSAD